MLERNIRGALGGQQSGGIAQQPQGFSDEFSGQAQEFDLRRLINIGRRRLPIILGFAIIGTLLALVYALQLTPRYTAVATVLIDPREQNVMNTEEVLAGIGRDMAAIESETRLMRSSQVAMRVVDQLNLLSAPQIIARDPTLVGTLVGGALARSQEPDPLLEEDAKERIARNLSGDVRTARVGQSYLINISYTHEDRAFATRITNGFADAYLVDQLESKFEATQRANEWLNDRVTELRDQVTMAERAVERFRSENNLLEAEGGITLNDQQIATLNEQLITARADAASAQVRLEQLQQTIAQGGEVTSFADATSASFIVQLQGRLSDVRRQYTDLSTRYGGRHPEVITARAQVTDIEGQLASVVGQITASVENEYRVALSREQAIETSLAAQKGDTAQFNQTAVQLRELERQAEASRSLYEAFLARFQETTEQVTLQTAESRIVERAAVPTVPSEPNKKAIALIGAVLSLGLGIAGAFLLEKLDNGFRTSEQLEAATGAPVLALVPVIDNPKASGFSLAGLKQRLVPQRLKKRRGIVDQPGERDSTWRYVVEKPLSPFTEGIRSLRMALRYSDIDSPAKAIVVTSAIPGEGKSTIASNLALHAAQAGETVLLIDLDLRHPTLTGLYSPDAAHGVVELLTGGLSPNTVLRMDPETKLRFLPGATKATKVTHSADLLGSVKMRDLIQNARATFDLVVIDSPPLLPVADSKALVNSMDGVVLVVQWEKTKAEAVGSAIRHTFGLQQKLIGTVLSQIDPDRARYYHYYESSYYNKKYPYYYGEA